MTDNVAIGNAGEVAIERHLHGEWERLRRHDRGGQWRPEVAVVEGGDVGAGSGKVIAPVQAAVNRFSERQEANTDG